MTSVHDAHRAEEEEKAAEFRILHLQSSACEMSIMRNEEGTFLDYQLNKLTPSARDEKEKTCYFSVYNEFQLFNNFFQANNFGHVRLEAGLN